MQNSIKPNQSASNCSQTSAFVLYDSNGSIKAYKIENMRLKLKETVNIA